MFEVNSDGIPTLAVGFTRDLGPLGDAIAFCRGGFKAVGDIAFPTHAFLFTRDSERLFATEETAFGLREMSLSQYRSYRRRIVAVYYWRGWTEEKAEEASNDLVEVRAAGAEASKYDYRALLSFLPGVGRYFRPDPEREICSENVASIHKKYGARWVENTVIAPDQLLNLMQNSRECACVLNYYV